MEDAVEFMLLHRQSRHEMSVALAEEFGRPPGTPIPIDSLDGIIRRVNERWSAETILTRAQTRERQLRRLYRRLRQLRAAGHVHEASDIEKLIAKIEGNLAAREIVASTSPGKPLEVTVRDPRKMTHGERQRRIAELSRRNEAIGAAVGAGLVAAVAGATTDPGEPGEVQADGAPEKKTGTEG